MKYLILLCCLFGLLYCLGTGSNAAPPDKLNEVAWSKVIAESKAEQLKEEVIVEAVQPDRSRVDILTSKYAYEVEWSYKWKESIGQAVLYSLQTNREPGVILLMDGHENEHRDYLRCLAVCGRLGIRLETWNTTK